MTGLSGSFIPRSQAPAGAEDLYAGRRAAPAGLDPSKVLNQSAAEVAAAAVQGMLAFQPRRADRERVVSIETHLASELLENPHIHAATPAQLLLLSLFKIGFQPTDSAQKYDLPDVQGKERVISDVVAACQQLAHSSCPPKMILLYGPKGDHKEQVLKFLAASLEKFLGQASENPLRNLAYRVTPCGRQTSGFKSEWVEDQDPFIIPELGGAPAFSAISNEVPGEGLPSQREVLLIRLNERLEELKKAGLVPQDFEISAEHFLRSLQGPRMRLLNMAFSSSAVSAQDFASGFVAQERPFDRRAGQGLVWITPNSDPNASLTKLIGEGIKAPGTVAIAQPGSASAFAMLPPWMSGVAEKLDTVQSPWIDSNNGVAFVTSAIAHLSVIAGILDSKELSFRTGSGNVVIPYSGLIVACCDSEEIEKLDYDTLERLRTYALPIAVGNCSDFISQAQRLANTLAPKTHYGRHALPLFALAVASTGVLEPDHDDPSFVSGPDGALMKGALKKLSSAQKTLLYSESYLADYPNIAQRLTSRVTTPSESASAGAAPQNWSIDLALNLKAPGLEPLSGAEMEALLLSRQLLGKQHGRSGELISLSEFLFGITDDRAQELAARLARDHSGKIEMIDVIAYLENLQRIGLTSHARFIERKEALRRQQYAEIEKRQGGIESLERTRQEVDAWLDKQFPLPDPNRNLDFVYRIAREWLVQDIFSVLGKDQLELKVGSQARKEYLAELRSDWEYYAQGNGDLAHDLEASTPLNRALRLKDLIEGFARLGYDEARAATYLEFATRSESAGE